MARKLKIGGKRLGGSFEFTRDGAGNPCWHGVIWLQRGNRLRYRYPSLTLIGWRPVFELQ